MNVPCSRHALPPSVSHDMDFTGLQAILELHIGHFGEVSKYWGKAIDWRSAFYASVNGTMKCAMEDLWPWNHEHSQKVSIWECKPVFLINKIYVALSKILHWVFPPSNFATHHSMPPIKLCNLGTKIINCLQIAASFDIPKFWCILSKNCRNLMIQIGFVLQNLYADLYSFKLP